MHQPADENIKNNVDWVTFFIYLILIICGWLSIYGASYDYENVKSIYDLSGRAGMQLVWMGTSLVIAFVLLKLDSQIYDTFSYLIYAFFILLLLVTVFVAPDIKGSRSWLVITNSIRLQPAEFAKFAVALALASFMSSYNFKLLTTKNLSIIITIIILPMILILLQKETGSALVYTAFILVLYREGLPSVVLFSGLSAIVFFVVGLKFSETDIGILTTGEFISIVIVIVISAILARVFSASQKQDRAIWNIILGTVILFGGSYLLTLLGLNIDFGIIAIVSLVLLVVYLIFLAKQGWSQKYMMIVLFAVSSIVFVSSINYLFNDILQPHQQVRIKVSLGMEEDLMGAGYNVNQSKIAIGSGGLIGKGYLNGTQTKLKYVPEQDTDFIFCTVGEEEGFVGSIFVLILFLVLIVRLIYLAERQTYAFGRIYGYCVACIFFFHLVINIGMVIGLTPVIGIPLPFFSYGGSSLWGFTILLFIFLRIDMYRKRRQNYR